jgi:serine/threonine protein kinase/type II secretory pathway pseudopilin PulG
MDTQPSANCCPKCQTALPPDAPQGLCPKCLFAAVATPTEADQPAGNRPAPPTLTEIAAAFPQLEILEFIGQGGMGFVFKARQPKLDRLVALKILPQSLAADPTFAERFNREAKLLARLNHPGIVTVHDFGVATGRADLPVRPDVEAAQQHRPTTPLYYLLMEFVDGVNLRQAMQAGRFTPAQALAIVPKICEALQFAHNEGILHRDIKPENILLDAKGRVKIADFGIAKLVEGRAGSPLPAAESPNTSGAQGTARPTTELTEAGKTLGSPNYMAPEQLEHPGEVDHRADIYSLGVVFYEMLTGELPLGRFAPPSQKSAADPRVDEVVLRALEKERERRQHSAGEVKTQVETIAATPHSADQKNANASISKSRFGRIVLVGVSNEKRAINWTGVIQIWVVICGVMLAGAYIAFGRWVPFHDLIASIVGVATLVTAAWVKVELKKPHDQLPPCGSRREEAQTEKAESGKRKSEIEPRFSPKAIVVAVLLVFIGSVLAFALVRNHIAKPTSMPLSETEFLQKFEANQIERATVSYNPQLPDVAKISGTYYRTDKDGNIIKTEKEVPFIVENALITPNLERKLVRSDKIVFNTPNPMLKAAAYNLLFFAGIGMVILLLLGIIIYVVTLVMKRPVGAPVPPVQKPDRFWRWFAVAVFAMIAIPFLISIFGLLAAIAIPNFVKARAQAQANAQRAAAQLTTKTIMLTRATNQLVGTTSDTRTVGVWSDTTVLPGEKFRQITRLPDGETTGADASLFSRSKAGKLSTSTSFIWWFREGDGFGAAEADAATAQIREHWTQTPLTFTSSAPCEVFCVTNQHGVKLAGSIEFVHTAPQPPDAAGQIKATVQVKHFGDFISFPGIGFRAEVPDGYELRATSNYGEGEIHSPAGPYDYDATWFPMNYGLRQSAVTALSWNLKHTPPANAPSMANEQSEKFQIVLGQPRLIVSITNSPDDVFQGFLELVGPPEVGATKF